MNVEQGIRDLRRYCDDKKFKAFVDFLILYCRKTNMDVEDLRIAALLAILLKDDIVRKMLENPTTKEMIFEMVSRGAHPD